MSDNDLKQRTYQATMQIEAIKKIQQEAKCGICSLAEAYRAIYELELNTRYLKEMMDFWNVDMQKTIESQQQANAAWHPSKPARF